MSGVSIESAGGLFRVVVTDEQGNIKTARLGLGSRTDDDFNTVASVLRQAYPTLRQWAGDAATVNTNWPTMTAAQKDAAMRTTIQRLGIFLDRFADLLQMMNTDA